MMGKKQEDGSLTPVQARPLIPRVNGEGHYELGDRVLARDLVRNVTEAGTVSEIASSGAGKDYLIVTYGDDIFEDYFLCMADDVKEMLPDPEDAEQLEAWLESGA